MNNFELNCHSIAAWEKAMECRQDIQFIEIRTHCSEVVGARGYIIVKGKQYRAQWVYDGRCYHNGRRMQAYDIAL